MSANAMDTVINDYSIKAISLRWINLFNKLLVENSIPKQQKIKVPKIIKLPSSNPEFKREDKRKPLLSSRLNKYLDSPLNLLRFFKNSLYRTK